MIANAAQLLSSLSSFVGVITAPKKPSVFHHIEFMRLSERRVLVILVAPDGDVQNRVIFTAHDYTAAQLHEASNFLTAHYAGLTLEEVRERLKTEVDALRGEISALMQAAVQAGSEAMAESHEQVVDRRRAQSRSRSRTSRATWAACASCSTCSSRRRS